MNERILKVRTTLGLSQERFGNIVGISRSAVSNMESGRYNVTDTLCILICKEFNVNETWLFSGEGEMFNEVNDNEFERLADELGMTPKIKALCRIYFDSSNEKKEAFEYYLDKFVEECKNTAAKPPNEEQVTTSPQDPILQRLAELESEIKQQTAEITKIKAENELLKKELDEMDANAAMDAITKSNMANMGRALKTQSTQ